MDRGDRQKYFARAYSWKRRRSFVLFLVQHGYVYCPSTCTYSNFAMEVGGVGKARCDILFDVEDISRYVCTFL